MCLNHIIDVYILTYSIDTIHFTSAKRETKNGYIRS